MGGGGGYLMKTLLLTFVYSTEGVQHRLQLTRDAPRSSLRRPRKTPIPLGNANCASHHAQRASFSYTNFPPSYRLNCMSFSTERAAWMAGLMLAIAYVGTLCVFMPLPLQDYPAHLANAVALSDLIFHGGKQFGDLFSFQFLLMPYVLGDLAFAACVDLLGRALGSAVWVSFVFLSLPLALLLFMRIAGIAAERRPLVFILSLYLASDWFFAMGFLNFRLGISLIVVNFALLIRLRNAWSNRVYAGYSALVILSYLVHLTTLALFTPLIGVSALVRLWKRTTSWGKEALLGAPLIGLWAWNLWVVPRFSRAGDPIENPYYWGSIRGKLVDLDYQFMRYDRRLDVLMLAVFIACLIISAVGTNARALKSFAVREMSLLAATFVGVYLVLPRGYSEAWYVDVRALALVSLCVVVAFAYLPGAHVGLRARTSAVAAALAVALVATNLVYLGVHLARSEVRVAQYRAVVASIPPGARVLPVMTSRREGYVFPWHHMEAFIVIDRGAFMPYAFNADTANPEKYLRYVSKRYTPPQNWYLQQKWSEVDWNRVATEYDYLLVEKPFDAQRIPRQGRLIAENASAALFSYGGPHVAGSGVVPRYGQRRASLETSAQIPPAPPR